MKEIIEALQFYGDRKNYSCVEETSDYWVLSKVMEDQGKIAREVMPMFTDISGSLGLEIIDPDQSFILVWKGKAVGKNRKLIRTKKSVFRNSAYSNFVQELINAFKIQGKVISGQVRVTMKIVCHNRADHHNFIEPILDAMQFSGCIENDRDVAELVLPRPERHGNKVMDMLIIKVDGLKET